MCKVLANKNQQEQEKYQLFDREQETDQKQGFFDFTVVDQVKKSDGSRDFIMRHHNEMVAPLKLGELRSRYKVAPVQFMDLTEERETAKEIKERLENKKQLPMSGELVQKIQRSFNAMQYRQMLYQKSIAAPGTLSENEQVLADIYKIDNMRSQYKQQYDNRVDSDSPFEGSLKRLVDSHTKQLTELKNKNQKYHDNFTDYSKNKYYGQMNDYLRTGNPKTSREIRKKCNDLISSLEEFKLDEDMTLTRHMGLDGLVAGLGLDRKEITTSEKLFEVFRNMRIHRVISVDKAFCSTTLNPDGVSKFKKMQVECRILAPKGTKGACIRNISRYKGEDEVLLQTNTKLQLLGVSDEGEWTDHKNKNHKDRKIVVYLKAVPAEILEMEDVRDKARLSDKYQNDHKKQAAFMSSRYEISNSAERIDLRPSHFGYSTIIKKGVKVTKMKPANPNMWSDAVNKTANRCLMILAVYYSRHRDKSVLDGNDLNSKEIKAIQKEVEDTLSSRSVDAKTQAKISRLLLEMRAGIAVNLSSGVMGYFKDKAGSLDGMSSALPYMQAVMLMQKAYEEISSSIKIGECKNLCKREDSLVTNEVWQKRLNNLSKCSRDHYEKIQAYRKLMSSQDPMKEQRNKGINVMENPFGEHEDHLRNLYKSFCTLRD